MFYYTYYIHYVNIGPKAPGAHRAHGPRPLGPMGASLGLGKATYSQAKLPTVRHAPNNRIHAPNRAIDMHPKAAYMHPKVSIDLHPTTAYFAPNRAIDMHPKGTDFAPKRHRFAPKSSRIHAPNFRKFYIFLKVCRMVQDLSKSVPMVFRSPGKPLIKLFHSSFN